MLRPISFHPRLRAALLRRRRVLCGGLGARGAAVRGVPQGERGQHAGDYCAVPEGQHDVVPCSEDRAEVPDRNDCVFAGKDYLRERQ